MIREISRNYFQLVTTKFSIIRLQNAYYFTVDFFLKPVKCVNTSIIMRILKTRCFTLNDFLQVTRKKTIFVEIVFLGLLLLNLPYVEIFPVAGLRMLYRSF